MNFFVTNCVLSLQHSINYVLKMSEKYTFNPDNLDYQSESKASKISKIVLSQLVIIVFLAIAIFFVLSYTTDTVVEKNLRHENKVLSEEYDRMYEQYLKNEKNLNTLQIQDSNLYKVIFGSSQLKDSDKVNTKVELLQGRKALKVAKNNSVVLEKMVSSYMNKRDEYIAFVKSLEDNGAKIDSIPSIMPLPNPDLQFSIYGYGTRLDPVYHIPAFHTGIDIKAPFGTPVFATANGTVVNTTINNRLKGNYVVIKHGDYSTGYYHLQRLIVNNYQRVKKGQVIGYVGSTGKSLVEHLHYEIKYKGNYVNPIFYFFTDVEPLEYLELYKKSTVAGIKLD